MDDAVSDQLGTVVIPANRARNGIRGVGGQFVLPEQRHELRSGSIFM